MPKKKPAHPGRTVRHDCLEPLSPSVIKGAKILGVSRQALNNIVNGKSGISPEMAIRLTKAFGSTEETWLRMQVAYDLAAAAAVAVPTISFYLTKRDEPQADWQHYKLRYNELGHLSADCVGRLNAGRQQASRPRAIRRT